MTTPKAKFAGLALIAALCGGLMLGLTAPAWAGLDEGVAAADRGDYLPPRSADSAYSDKWIDHLLEEIADDQKFAAIKAVRI